LAIFHLPAFELVPLQDLRLSLPVADFGCRHSVAGGELFAFTDWPLCPEHDRGAVVDWVHVGVAAVVHQAAGQEQSSAQWHWRQARFHIEIGTEAVHDRAVEQNYQVQFQESCANSQKMIRWDEERVAEVSDTLKKKFMSKTSKFISFL
jgi:hypothetical protein